MSQFMANHVIYNPLWKHLYFPANTDIPIRRTSVRTAPQTGFHIPHPTDTAKADLAIEAGTVEQPGAFEQVIIGGSGLTLD